MHQLDLSESKSVLHTVVVRPLRKRVMHSIRLLDEMRITGDTIGAVDVLHASMLVHESHLSN